MENAPKHQRQYKSQNQKHTFLGFRKWRGEWLCQLDSCTEEWNLTKRSASSLFEEGMPKSLGCILACYFNEFPLSFCGLALGLANHDLKSDSIDLVDLKMDFCDFTASSTRPRYW